MPFQGYPSPPDIQKQAKHLLHEYKLDDETLQKAQLEQQRIFQNFPTSPAPATPNAHPLSAGMNPEVSTLLEPNDANNDSSEMFFDTQSGNALLDNNDKSLAQTHICRKSALTLSSLQRGSLN